MKNLLFLLAASISLLSCEIKYDNAFYKDKTMNMEISVSMESFMFNMIKQNQSDSLKKNEILTDLPKDWTTLYDVNVKNNKPMSNHPDSIKYMKMIEMRVVESGGKSTIGMRTKRSKAKEHGLLLEFLDKQPTNNLSANKRDLPVFTWDGKKLTMRNTQSGLNDEQLKMTPEELKASAEQNKNFFSSGQMVIEYVIRFEGKVKKITGDKGLLKKIDAKTLSYRIDMKDVNDYMAKGERPPVMDEVVEIWVK